MLPSTSSTTVCRNAFWAVFLLPAICYKGIQAAQKLVYMCQCNNNDNNYNNGDDYDNNNNNNKKLTWAGYHNPARAISPIGSLKEKTANHLPYFPVRHFGAMVINAQRGSNIALL